MPLIISHTKRFDSTRVKSHVLPRPSSVALETTKKRGYDLESFSHAYGTSDVFSATARPVKIGRFSQIEDSDGNTSSDESLFSYSPRPAFNTPLTLQVAVPRKIIKGTEPLMGCDLPRNRPDHILGVLRIRDTAGSLDKASVPLSATIDRYCEIKRGDGSSHEAPIFFSQFNGGETSINVAIKCFPQEISQGTRDHRGYITSRATSTQARQQFKIAQKLGNVFAPLHLNELSGVTYIDYPLAKASLSDVIRSVYGAHSHCARLDEKRRRSLRSSLTWRLMKDLLTQLIKLHDLKYSHNNLRPSNILIDNTGHFHLIGFGAAAKAGLPDNGDWNNKRLEAVFNYGDHDSRKDDLWALGKLFVRLITQPQNNAENSINPLWDALDPFRPDYIYPSHDNVNNIRLPVEVSTLPENKAEAESLHELWTELYRDYKGWYSRKNEARKMHRKIDEPFPALRRFETPELQAHANRIYKIFERLSRKDEDGNALRFALALFNPSLDDTTTAYKLKRQFTPVFDYLFMSDETSRRFSAPQQIAPSSDQNPNVVCTEHPILSKADAERLKRYRDNEGLLAKELSLIEGEGMRLCNQHSASHTIRSPSPKPSRLGSYDL